MLFPDRVYELAQLGSSRGIAPRLSTNGFWAESPAVARAEVCRLREAGFAHVWISTDSFHAESVPVERAHILIEALKEARLAFFVNLNYLLPVGEEIGGLGLPQVRPEVERDGETFRIHQEIGKRVDVGAHGWCRVMDLGRGKDALNSLGRRAAEARRILARYREQVERPSTLELAANGDVIHRCKAIGNVNTERFPSCLDVLS